MDGGACPAPLCLDVVCRLPVLQGSMEGQGEGQRNDGWIPVLQGSMQEQREGARNEGTKLGKDRLQLISPMNESLRLHAQICACTRLLASQSVRVFCLCTCTEHKEARP
eukprot:scaffold312049_cov19-Tisochrysis_lutea.AAC.1